MDYLPGFLPDGSKPLLDFLSGYEGFHDNISKTQKTGFAVNPFMSSRQILYLNEKCDFLRSGYRVISGMECKGF